MADASAPPPALRTLIEDIAQKQNYNNPQLTITPLSTGGGNYTSELFLITVTAPGHEDLRLFAKVANVNGKIRDEGPITKCYETERFVYGSLVDIFSKIEEKNSVAVEHRLRFPKYYGCNPKLLEETIVLEDLGARGFDTHDRLKSIDWLYAATAVAELAKFHALSFAYQEENPEEFAQVIKERKFEFGSDERMKVMWEGMVREAVGACREESRARLAKYLMDNVKRVRDYYEPLRRPVLVHGDYRPSNLMHKIRPDGSVEMIPVDWQMVRAGCLATDLMYLIFTGSDAAFRASHYTALLEEYYRQLCAALRRLKLDPEAVYPREDFDYELEQSLPYGLLLSVFVLPLVTVEAANAPKLDKLMSYDDWKVKTSSVFSDRINGVVDDYVAWGIL
ncbi:uncharacterized protein LOC125234494 [Leguminivora glycinivorella]|uniref:uncharacterized protein LOC125234494 n=1 Tax=Leguminivora glycinivorella TaxID=1035111 RepID=UPI00200BE022|nr:uncharacterized protein LOC125234494 [Leguminivora glycinivorella]